MVTGERFTITMTGGAPWGFRLQGGGSFPLEVAKIRKKSHASNADLREGDTVVSINGVPMSGTTHQSAMGLVEVANNQIVMEVIRERGQAQELGCVRKWTRSDVSMQRNKNRDKSSDEFENQPRSSSGASRPLDPQRQPRIIPMIDNQEKSGPGLVSTASADYSTTDGNTRTHIHTDEYVMNSAGGKRITKTVTEERVTRLQDSLSPSRAQCGISPAQSQGSIYGLSTSTSQNSVLSGEHVGRSPNRSPVAWRPPSLSPASDRSNILQDKSKAYQPNILETTDISIAPIAKPSKLKQPVKTDISFSPIAKPSKLKQPAKTVTVKESIIIDKPTNNESKENVDPIKMSEQAKWEARQGPSSVPKFKLENFGCNTFPRSASRRRESIERVDDPRYPMFEVYKPDWRPPVEVAPLVPPKALSPAPSPILPPDFSNGYSASHHPGMIRPPARNYEVLQLQPPPPPPPMPPAPGPPPTAPKPKKFRPGFASTPKHRTHEEEEHHHHPDHLPVFAPKVYFAPEDDSGFPGSPTRSDPMPLGDEHSDISSLGKAARKKLFSDSAFYDEPSHRYPTIDEQMLMCKKIAQSLTSAANRRAKGARMFLKRKRKSNKWVHDELTRFSCSEYSSEQGDVADLDDLDSELYVGEGGSKPLFQFRIPKIAGQSNPPVKMSLSKDEFERLRLGSTKCDHHAVSPDMCFTIAADLHTNTRNKGAKLFHKRQQRVEKFVIDETNVTTPVSPPTKLEQILRNPEPMHKTPWNAASQGTMQYTGPMPTAPKHTLEPQGEVKLLGGDNYNRKIKGWVSSSQPSFQESDVFVFPPAQSNYPPVFEEVSSRSRTEDFVQSTVDYHAQEQTHNQPQFGDYNRRVKGWNVPAQAQAPVSQLSEQYRYKGSETYFPLPGSEL